ncbi:NERD domain-containing protein [Filobacillus milosensis]|uniref:NERD domain-containing protein n=1 Tax=Filobacillus milosensis TaxID=94137 RepID=A0A4Y8IFX8_9BACI|nr:nuclease-related domain-containing protein [Filobacillus milosensis]TFB19235.1 NERD domain-containing protein [Filobacillus milosensis]
MGQSLEVPISLLRTIAFNFNMDANHINQQSIKQDLAKYISGYRGEKSIKYFMYNIINKNYKVFHNARLFTKGQNFEIDVLMITDQFLSIIDVKNTSGNIRFDHEFGAMYQKYQGKEKVYQDPIEQVNRHKRLLEIWLNERGYKIPIETLVCFVNKHAILERGQSPVDPRIIYGYKLAQKYKELQEKYQNHPSKILTNKLINQLTEESNPLDQELFKKYGMNKEDFKPGVICSQCLKKTVKRQRHHWICAECGFTDHEAPIRALKDYFLIFGPKITNEQARQWLNENNADYVKRLLDKWSVRKEGTGRSLVYYLDFDYQTDFEYLLNYLEKHFKRPENKF